MFKFRLEPTIPCLTATRTGFWTLETVVAYEIALRRELTQLRLQGRSTAFIIDIRSSGAQTKEVADALRTMVAGLGRLHADRTAVVTSGGIAKLQAKRVADGSAQVFTSMVLARDWVMGRIESSPLRMQTQPPLDRARAAILMPGPNRQPAGALWNRIEQ